MGEALIDTLRGLTAAAVLLASVVHLDLYASGFHDVHPIGELFVLDFAAGLVIAVTLLVWRHWLPALAAAGFAAATVIAYWITVVHGLFGIRETTSGWAEITAQVAEYAAVLLGLAAAVLLRRQSRAGSSTTNRHDVSVTGASGDPIPK